MFAKRPRFDDTFGVRMDLGADRMDPMSLRPASEAGQLRVKAPVIVERPVSIFDVFRGRDSDPLAALTETPAQMPSPRTDANPQIARSSRPRDETLSGPRAFEGGPLSIWQRLTAGQRIGLAVFGALFLLASGLWLPAIVIAVVYFAVRSRAA